MPVADVQGFEVGAEWIGQRDDEVVACRSGQPRLAYWHRVPQPEVSSPVVPNGHREQFDCPRRGLGGCQDELSASLIGFRLPHPPTETYVQTPPSMGGRTQSTRKCSIVSGQGPRFPRMHPEDAASEVTPNVLLQGASGVFDR